MFGWLSALGAVAKLGNRLLKWRERTVLSRAGEDRAKVKAQDQTIENVRRARRAVGNSRLAKRVRARFKRADDE